jgi:hypothetical protein
VLVPRVCALCVVCVCLMCELSALCVLGVVCPVYPVWVQCVPGLCPLCPVCPVGVVCVPCVCVLCVSCVCCVMCVMHVCCVLCVCVCAMRVCVHELLLSLLIASRYYCEWMHGCAGLNEYLSVVPPPRTTVPEVSGLPPALNTVPVQEAQVSAIDNINFGILTIHGRIDCRDLHLSHRQTTIMTHQLMWMK